MSRRRAKTPWYTASRLAQERWKATTPSIPDEARRPGQTWVEDRGVRKLVGPFPVCLPLAHTAENLIVGVRGEAIERFARHGIEWHHASEGPDGTPWPSGHLLDSQVQCVNTLLSLAAQPDRGLAFARSVEPQAHELVEVEDGSVVAFEWIGARDYLGERRGRPAARGRFTTSIDAFLVARRVDGGLTGIIVEWKFTESYSWPVPYIRRNGTDRRDTYRPFFEAKNTPFAIRPDISAFFQEPHYQLMRQALLGAAMVRAGEFGIDQAVLLHLVPVGNHTLRRTVPEGLKDLGDEIDAVWHRLLPGPVVRYICIDTAPLFRATPELANRYGMLVQ